MLNLFLVQRQDEGVLACQKIIARKGEVSLLS